MPLQEFVTTMSSSTAAPPIRSLRKRQPAKLADDIDFDLESLLKEHEKTGIEFRAKRAKKQKNVEDSDDDEKNIDAFKGCENIPLDSLPSLCIEKIFSMVSLCCIFVNYCHPVTILPTVLSLISTYNS